ALLGQGPTVQPGPREHPLPTLRSAWFFLTKPNTSSTIEVPASLRSERCSPSARNAVRVPFGISVRLRRNPQLHLAVGGYRGRNIRQLESRESVRSVSDLLKNIGRAYQKL